MFKYLQRIFGKSSSSYESLMESRDKAVELSEASIETIKDALKPIVLPASRLQLKMQGETTYPKLPSGSSWPVNKKGEPLTYLGTVSHLENSIAIFKHIEGLKKDESNIQIINFKSIDEKALETLEPENPQLISQTRYYSKEITSLPIWEEIIHRNKDIHKLIVKLAPEHPWTLYKKAKKELVGVPIHEQIGGYPQWIINDVDFRKVNNSEFLIQIYTIEENQIMYYFSDGNLLHSIKQVI